VAVAVFFVTAIWNPSITGQAVSAESQELVVILKPSTGNLITGALVVGDPSVEDMRFSTAVAQEEVLEDVNSPSFIERIFNIDPEPDVKAETKFDVVPAMVVKATPEGIEELKAHPRVEAVYPNIMFDLQLSESVPLINADEVVNNNIDGQGVSVCVVDTGIDASHPAFQGRVVDQKCFCSGNCCPNGQSTDTVATDTHPQSHGTHVAGIVGANGNKIGVAPGVNIVAVKVCSSGCGLFDIFSGLDYCLQRKDDFNIVAISGSIGDNGKYQTQEQCPTFFDSAIDAAYNAGITSVFASGNNGYSNGISYPGCSPNAIGVGAVTKTDAIASYSNLGPLLEVLAPGSSIVSTQAGNSYGTLSGTSQATPHVSGAVALIQQYAQKSELVLTPDDVKDTLVATGKNVGGYPRIDVFAALQNLGLQIPINMSNQTNATINQTNQTQTNQTNVTNIPPVPIIIKPSSIVATNPVNLEGSATDVEDGVIPEDQLTWMEEDMLGTGSLLTHSFDLGQHTVKLIATDSKGLTGETEVTFSISSCVNDLDQNADQSVNIGDMILLLTDIFSETTECVSLNSEPTCLIDLDQTKDGVVNIGDAILILTGIIEENTEDIYGQPCYAAS